MTPIDASRDTSLSQLYMYAHAFFRSFFFSSLSSSSYPWAGTLVRYPILPLYILATKIKSKNEIDLKSYQVILRCISFHFIYFLVKVHKEYLLTGFTGALQPAHIHDSWKIEIIHSAQKNKTKQKTDSVALSCKPL